MLFQHPARVKVHVKQNQQLSTNKYDRNSETKKYKMNIKKIAKFRDQSNDIFNDNKTYRLNKLLNSKA